MWIHKQLKNFKTHNVKNCEIVEQKEKISGNIRTDFGNWNKDRPEYKRHEWQEMICVHIVNDAY